MVESGRGASGSKRPSMKHIDASPWAAAWIAPLEANGDPSRISRGKRYLREGQVAECRLFPGEIRGAVWGSEPWPYQVTVTFRTRGDALVHSLSERSERTPGPGENDSVSLAPRWSEIVWSCSCPDWGYPCKHGAAIWYHVAGLIGQDPNVFFSLLGVGRTQERGMHGDGGARETPGRASSGEPLGKPRPAPLVIRGITAQWFWEGGPRPSQTSGGTGATASDGAPGWREDALPSLAPGTAVGWAYRPPMAWPDRKGGLAYAQMLARAYAAISSETRKVLAEKDGEGV